MAPWKNAKQESPLPTALFVSDNTKSKINEKIMIDTLIKNLEYFKAAENSLRIDYPLLLPKVFYENANIAIYENVPTKVQELSKALNFVNKNNSFPEKSLNYDTAIQMLMDRKDEILHTIKKSKELKDSVLVIPGIDLSPYKMIIILIDQIGTTGEMALIYLRAAKLTAGEN